MVEATTFEDYEAWGAATSVTMALCTSLVVATLTTEGDVRTTAGGGAVVFALLMVVCGRFAWMKRRTIIAQTVTVEYSPRDSV